MARHHQLGDLVDAAEQRHHHQRAGLDIGLELLEAASSAPPPRHARHPGAERRADQHADQHRDELRARAFRRICHHHHADKRADDGSERQADRGAMHHVGLVEVARFVKRIELGAALARKRMWRSSTRASSRSSAVRRAFHVGQNEIQASAHDRLLACFLDCACGGKIAIGVGQAAAARA